MEAFNIIAKIYDSFLIQFFYSTSHKRILYFIKDILSNSMSILDIGCATGNFLGNLKNISRDSYLVGIDKSPEMIRIAKKKNKDIYFKNMSAENLFFRKDFFNLITIIDSFYYFEDKSSIISQVNKNLKTGGYLLIYTPLIDNILSKILITSINWFPTEKKSKHLTFTEIENITKENNLTLIEKSVEFFPFTPIKYHLLLFYKK